MMIINKWQRKFNIKNFWYLDHSTVMFLLTKFKLDVVCCVFICVPLFLLTRFRSLSEILITYTNHHFTFIFFFFFQLPHWTFVNERKSLNRIKTVKSEKFSYQNWNDSKRRSCTCLPYVLTTWDFTICAKMNGFQYACFTQSEKYLQKKRFSLNIKRAKIEPKYMRCKTFFLINRMKWTISILIRVQKKTIWPKTVYV